MAFVDKIFHLVKCFFVNNGQFHYLLKHHFDKTVRTSKAKKICAKNEKSYKSVGLAKLDLLTYDGSNQFTHPDMVFWNNAYWLVVTPYPYGIEAYENPCLYRSHDFNDFPSFVVNPIASQGAVKKGCHLSDPFFCTGDKNLIVLYRRNEIIDGKDYVAICYRVLDLGNDLSKENVLIGGNEDFLSPVMYKKGSGYIFQYMNRKGVGSEIKKIVFDQHMRVVQTKALESVGFPKDYYFWHFGIDHETERSIKGLILLRSSFDRNSFMLCEAEFLEKENAWRYSRGIRVSEKYSINIDHLYKSCYVPNANKILLSYKDTKGRYYCSLLDQGDYTYESTDS